MDNRQRKLALVCGFIDCVIVLLIVYWCLVIGSEPTDFRTLIRNNSTTLLFWVLPLLLLTFWRGMHDGERSCRNDNWFGRATIEGFQWGLGFAVLCGMMYYIQSKAMPGGEEWLAPAGSLSSWLDYLFLIAIFGLVTGSLGSIVATLLHFFNRVILMK